MRKIFITEKDIFKWKMYWKRVSNISLFYKDEIKPYLETTKSKLVENTKAYNELTIVKELGKLTT